MSNASEALAEVRGWLCDNLSEGDAGKVCGMLSVVSRHITRLETESARLDQKRIGLHAEVERLSGIIHRQRKQLVDVQDALERRNAENAKLRELVREAVAFLDDDDPCNDCGHDAECFEQNGLCVAYEGGCLMLGLLVNRARELGVEVDNG